MYPPVKDRANIIDDKIEVLSRLLKVWIKTPELRLGQMLVIASGGDPFYIEDFDLLEKVEERFAE